MKRASGLVLVVAMLIVPGLFAAEKRAKTEDGRDVILRDDGTWYYVGDVKKVQKAAETYRGKRGTFTLSLAPGVWRKLAKPTIPVSEVEFAHKDGDAMGVIIAERISVPLATLKNAVLNNIRNAAQEVKLVEEEKRTVNGVEVLFLAVNAKVQGIAFTYFYYLYTGEAGSIQILTFTGQNLLKEFRPDMEAFMNGFELVRKEKAK
jgi:hypothetical protein